MGVTKDSKALYILIICGVLFLTAVSPALAGEADIVLPDLGNINFSIFGSSVNGISIMYFGLLICIVGLLFGLYQSNQTKNLPAHKSMLDVSEIIWETCKSYLTQQGKFLVVLWVLIALCMIYYFAGLQSMAFSNIVVILFCSVLGILGSYGVAWFGMRINTRANSRTAFASLKGTPVEVVTIPMRSGMSVGLLLVSVELFFMICILVFLPKGLVGPSFIGFAIGESLGASALRICGGIFTKIADIGSDLMKIIFHLPEDDPKNPGVIADCTGDNAGDSVGPTADGFETYGVTGVALITFLALALAGNAVMGGTLIIWIFAMRILMILTSLVSYFINAGITTSLYGDKKKFSFEQPLTNLVWLTSAISIIVTFLASYVLLGANLAPQYNSLWWALAIIISCGTVAGALIPEFTKVFTSTKSRHVQEIVGSARQGGASLDILSGFVCGNYSAFWEGLTILVLMLIAYLVSMNPAIQALMPEEYAFAAPVFAFGLVAFGFLGMGPVTIAVDSFGPVSDNAQSIYELSRIESVPNIQKEIKAQFGFEPDFENGKDYLEEADGAGNTFKATAKPVLIGTAVVGATTMVFGIVILLDKIFGGAVAKLSLVQPEIVLGLLMGGAVIYWFTGAATQAVVTGAYRAVVYIKENIKLDSDTASIQDSKEVVKICTQYAQKGMINIFIVIFFLALSLSFFNPYFFIGYLIAIAFFGLFQAIFMANAGGAWDNAKKIVEVDLKEKNTPLHEATVVGDTVGDPFKDTSSVSMNPVIKFTTLFGLLATEIAVTMQSQTLKTTIASIFFLIALVFVYRSFYGMRIGEENL
ncbi:MAG: sodium-translocating pyrophosphatase [Candidatus Tectomicrobia bacterium]|uniref:K(+)-insensitive pyrophosphate-energized proton pump n=1 Tax=Tectimicrobiota bacterium TaxID=2528274 RepID=A0A933GKP2_UNCTE|nr:sodium-translocating pyrophosphatase [Candidatus Tectomicrobia bacterium]